MHTIIRQTGLMLASIVVVLAGWAAFSIDAVFDRREDRLQRRSPAIITSTTSEAQAVGWYQEGADIAEDRQFSIIGLIPITDNAAPPPGLPRWPQAGEAFLSPGLLAVDNDQVYQQRYGRFAGTIGPQGVADENEFFVYYRPPVEANPQLTEWSAISAFGSSSPYVGVGHTSDWTRSQAMLHLALLVGIPMIILVAVSMARWQSHPRGTGRSTGTAVPRRARLKVALREGIPPISIGISAGTLAALATTFSGVAVPVTDYRIAPADLAPDRYLLVPLAIMAALGMLVCIGAAEAIFGMSADRTFVKRTAARSGAQWPGWVAAIGVVACVLGIRNGGSTGRIVFALGMVAWFAALPILATRLMRKVGRYLVTIGRRHTSISIAISGRRMAARPGVTAGYVTVLAIGLTFTTQVQVAMTVVDPLIGRALHLEETVGEQVIRVVGQGMDRNVSQFTQLVGGDRVLHIHTPQADQTALLGPVAPTAASVILSGSCEALHTVGEMTRCPDQRTAANEVYRRYRPFGQALESIGILGTRANNGQTVKITGGAENDRLMGVLVFNPDGASGLDAIKKLAYSLFALPDVTLPGQEWAGAVEDSASRVRSMLGIGLVGLIVLTMAGGLAFSSGFAIERDGSRPSSAPRSLRITGAVAMLTVFAPLVVATIAAAFIGVLLGSMFVAMENSGAFSMATLGVAIGCATAVALLCWLLCTAAARPRSARRPGRNPAPITEPGPCHNPKTQPMVR